MPAAPASSPTPAVRSSPSFEEDGWFGADALDDSSSTAPDLKPAEALHYLCADCPEPGQRVAPLGRYDLGRELLSAAPGHIALQHLPARRSLEDELDHYRRTVPKPRPSRLPDLGEARVGLGLLMNLRGCQHRCLYGDEVDKPRSRPVEGHIRGGSGLFPEGRMQNCVALLP